MPHPVFSPGHVAVITGAASGIGLAAARHFAGLGMKIVLADLSGPALEAAGAEVAAIAPGGRADLLVMDCDVGKQDRIAALCDAVYDRFGACDLLMNNAVTRRGGGAFAPFDDWHDSFEVNLFGVVGGSQVFAPRMIAQDAPALIVNTGSKQGITNPPGNLDYNTAKAAVKHFTEGLQHELRNTADCQVTPHLLVPGWTTTQGRAHQPGAWLPEQVVDYMLAALDRGDFYIICPDDDVTPAMDRKRILWAAGDITENRAPLSRWHPDYAAAFEDFEG
jgi:NAD(P)-dependent dehydrogenase (short-subunit alcohol dehydrogenase family)